jgi:hypothetical protein
MSSCKTGDLIPVTFENREFEVIVIDPHGLGINQPTLGFGFRMSDKYIGVPQSTLSKWVMQINGVAYLKLPSGKLLRVVQILGNDNNYYNALEISDWVDMAIDVLINPGKTTKSVKLKIGDFLTWFATKGLYATTYAKLFGQYTIVDDNALTAELNAARNTIKELDGAVRGIANIAVDLAEQMKANGKPITWKQAGNYFKFIEARDYASGKASTPPKWD